jgi:hypothetical protein
MFLDKKPWDNLETPEKIQLLTKNIAKRVRGFKFLYLFLAIRYMGKMITLSRPTENASASGVEDIAGIDKVVYQPLPSIHTGAPNVLNNYMMHTRAP